MSDECYECHSWDRLLVITLVPWKQLTNLIPQLEHACSFDSRPLPYHHREKSMLVVTKLLSRQIDFCRDKTFVMTSLHVCHDKTCFLLWQKSACHDNSFCHDKHMFCRNKSFVAPNIILSRQKFCCSKHTFVTTKDTFCRNKHATKMILVAAPASDTSPPFESGLV